MTIVLTRDQAELVRELVHDRLEGDGDLGVDANELRHAEHAIEWALRENDRILSDVKEMYGAYDRAFYGSARRSLWNA